MLVELSVVEQRYQAVLAVIRDGVPIVEVARRLEVSRLAVHRWLRWYEDQGLASLADRATRRLVSKDMTVTIRPAVPRDGEAAARAWRHVGAYYTELDPEHFQEPTEEGLADSFEEAFDVRGPRILRLVAEVDEAVVGWLYARLVPAEDDAATQFVRGDVDSECLNAIAQALEQDADKAFGLATAASYSSLMHGVPQMLMAHAWDLNPRMGHEWGVGSTDMGPLHKLHLSGNTLAAYSGAVDRQIAYGWPPSAWDRWKGHARAVIRRSLKALVHVMP
jgi:hypothetical protein